MSEKSKIIQKEDVIQAVVITDNFSSEFIPLTNDIPIALLPIVNVPLIDYTLECLALGGINEVFLFCSTHVEKISTHIRKSIAQNVNWSITLSVHVIVSESCKSFGDAMRDLDAKGILRDNFILLGANAVSNIKFVPIMNKHKSICKKDKGASMTLIYKKVAFNKKALGHQDQMLIVADKRSNRVLFHQKLNTTPKISKVPVPLEIMLDFPTTEIRYDLLDTQIAICSASVLPLFSDNFDFQTRDHLVRGLLNDELLTNTIYYFETEDYGASVTNLCTYQIISHDIIHRLVFPLVPDMGITNHEVLYMYLRNNVYRNKSVTLAKGCILSEDVVIAEGCSLSESTIVTRSTIGANCKIGKNVTISDSFIMNDCVIGDNVNVSHSIMGPKCVLGNNVNLFNNCVLGHQVMIKQGNHLEKVRIQSQKPSKGGEEIGKNAYRLRTYSETGSNSESDIEEISSRLTGFFLVSETESDESDDSSVSDKSEMSHIASSEPDDTNLFMMEVVDSLIRGFDEKLACDNLILEINSSRYAYNVSLKEVNYHVTMAILNMPFHKKESGQYLKSLSLFLKYFLPIFNNYIKNETAMHDCLQAIEDTSNNSTELLTNVEKVIHWLYNEDILSEEVIIKWHSNLDSSSRLFTQIEKFIKWLEEADEESESD